MSVSLTRVKHVCCGKHSHQATHCANHDRNMFTLILIETISQGSFHLSRTKHTNVVSLLNTASPLVAEEFDK